MHLTYRNPVTGGPTLPTYSCEISALTPKFQGQLHRHNSTTVYHAFRGQGVTEVDGERLEWSQGDIWVVPPWTWHHHENLQDDESLLYSITDQPAVGRHWVCIAKRPGNRGLPARRRLGSPVDGIAPREERMATPIKTHKVSHVVFNVSDIERSIRFYTEILGFKLSDRNSRGMAFLRHATDHHTIAFAPAPAGATPPPKDHDGAASGRLRFSSELRSATERTRCSCASARSTSAATGVHATSSAL